MKNLNRKIYGCNAARLAAALLIAVIAGIFSPPEALAVTDFSFGEIKVTADDPQAESWFGYSVAIDGNIAVVGAMLTDTRTYTNPGAAYIFEYCEGEWVQIAKVSNQAHDEGWFGSSVAVSGNTVVVGSSPVGFQDCVEDCPRVYIYERNQGGIDSWGLANIITIPPVAEFDSPFGASIAISGNTIVVGCRWGNLPNTSYGSAYVYERNQGGAENWGLAAVLTDSEISTRFGASVDISGNTIVVGAPLRYSVDTGAAYIFERNEGGTGNWGFVQQLEADDAAIECEFGGVVAIDGNTVVVGGRDPELMEKDPCDGCYHGAAYVFQREEGGAENWGQVKKLTPSDGPTANSFATSNFSSSTPLGIDANRIVVGGRLGSAAYLFERNEGGIGNWGETQHFNASDHHVTNAFGAAVAISGGWILVGSPFDDGLMLSDAGAAYFYD